MHLDIKSGFGGHLLNSFIICGCYNNIHKDSNLNFNNMYKDSNLNLKCIDCIPMHFVPVHYGTSPQTPVT